MTERRPRDSARGGAARLSVATVVAAGAAWLVLAVAARALGPAGYATFAVFWGLFFAIVLVLFGVQNETTRAVSSTDRARPVSEPPAHGNTREPEPRTPRLVPAGLVWGGTMALLLLVTGLVWGESVLGDDWLSLLCLAALGAVAYSGEAAVAGVLLGRGHWGSYGLLLVVESGLRLLLVVAVSLGGASVLGVSTATVAAMLAWIPLLVLPRLAGTLQARGDVPTREYFARTARTMTGAAAGALLVTGFPVLVSATSHGDLDADTGVVLAAVLITRAPLLVPLTVFQGAAIRVFVEAQGRVARPLSVASGGVLGVAALGAAAAAVLGPAVLRLAFGADYVASWQLMSVLVLAAGLLGVLTLSGAALLALQRHSAYALGWVVAGIVAALVLLIPAALEVRVPAALLAGPAAGLLVHISAIRAATRQLALPAGSRSAGA